MAPDARRPAPGRPAESSNRLGGRQSQRSTCYTPGPADPEYDLAAGDAEGPTSDPLTADEWAAVCMAESRDLAEVVE